jgi:DNA-binding IclR family transcriptional regulator
MQESSRRYSVKSAQRVLALLEFFAECRRPSTVKEICNALGSPQSSTSILMKSLYDAGFFDHDQRSGMYSPNIRLVLATAWIGEQLFSERSLMHLMEQIQAACGHSVMIGKQDRLHVRYLHVLQSTRHDIMRAETGSLRPLFRTASGRMLLTTKTEREMSLLLRRTNAMETDPALRVEEGAARHARETALRQGFAISMGSSQPGAGALAILLPVPRNSEPLTLSIGGPLKEIERDQKKLLAMVRELIAPLMAVVR